MALNYSHRPMFPARIAEENLVQGGSQEADVSELLPADPFGMDISSTVTAITGWLEDLGVNNGGYRGVDVSVRGGDFPLFAGWNFLWNAAAMEFQTFSGNRVLDHRIFDDTQFVNGVLSGDSWCLVDDRGVRRGCTSEVSGSGSVNVSVDSRGEDAGLSCGTGHYLAFTYALAHLGVRDLLTVERVCKSLRDEVRDDPLLWRSIHIDHPLNERITDDILLQLTDRAKGSLKCLSLVQCQRITDDGIKRVLDGNLRLTKLSVPGCTRLSIDGVMSCIRAFKMVAATGIRCLRIGGIFGVTQNHFEELISLLDIHNRVQVNRYKPHFYHRGNFYLSYEDDRPIDIELCPRCQNMRLVYDCPAEGCQDKDHATELCRACTLCIPRCVQCGKCVNDCEYEETFFLELLCSDCWKQVLQSQEGPDVGISVYKQAISQEPALSLHG